MKAVLVLAVLVLAASSTVADSPPSHMIPLSLQSIQSIRTELKQR